MMAVQSCLILICIKGFNVICKKHLQSPAVHTIMMHECAKVAIDYSCAALKVQKHPNFKALHTITMHECAKVAMVLH